MLGFRKSNLLCVFFLNVALWGVSASAQEIGVEKLERKLKTPNYSITKLPDLTVASPIVFRSYTADTWSVQFRIRNKGEKDITEPFSVSVLVDSERQGLIVIPGLAAGRTVTRRELGVLDCEGGHVRVMLDTGNNIEEASETNNNRSQLLVPPCPDLAVKEIRPKKMEDGRFRIKLVLQNKGNVGMPPSAISIGSGKRKGAIWPPKLEFREIGPLGAGMTKTITVGPKRLSRKNWFVHVDLDIGNKIVERDEENNIVHWEN